MNPVAPGSPWEPLGHLGAPGNSWEGGGGGAAKIPPLCKARKRPFSVLDYVLGRLVLAAPIFLEI